MIGVSPRGEVDESGIAVDLRRDVGVGVTGFWLAGAPGVRKVFLRCVPVGTRNCCLVRLNSTPVGVFGVPTRPGVGRDEEAVRASGMVDPDEWVEGTSLERDGPGVERDICEVSL